MKKEQKILVQLLCTAIHGGKINIEVNDKDWNIIFQMAKEHDIYALLYPTVKELDDNLKPKDHIMCEWKKSTILASLTQKRNVSRIGYVLGILNTYEIQAIALKGLIIRQFYPVKELRTMTDSDILIHIEDLDKVEEIFLSLGYVEKNRNSKHIHFLHKDFLPIEVHWLSLDLNRFKNADYMEKIIWENSEKFRMQGADVLVPSLENQILHLCFHMASHFIYAGFGLRQICDLVILVKKNWDIINWSEFCKDIKKCKMEKFVAAIFEISRRLFNMKIPDVLFEKELENSEYIDMIINSIFYGGIYKGIYGKHSMGPVDDNLLSYYENNIQSHKVTEKFKYMITLFFPSTRKLSERYVYAKKYPIFTPIAWAHRLIYGIFRTDFKVREKSFLLLLQSDFFKKRIDLFKWLDI